MNAFCYFRSQNHAKRRHVFETRKCYFSSKLYLIMFALTAKMLVTPRFLLFMLLGTFASYCKRRGFRRSRTRSQVVTATSVRLRYFSLSTFPCPSSMRITAKPAGSEKRRMYSQAIVPAFFFLHL